MSKRAQLKQQNPKARTPVAPLERRIHADIFAPMKTQHQPLLEQLPWRMTLKLSLSHSQLLFDLETQNYSEE